MAQLFSLGIMTTLISILVFAIALPLAIVCFVSAWIGIRKHRVYYGPSLPPITLDARPAAFVALCAFYIGFGVLFLAVSIALVLQGLSLL